MNTIQQITDDPSQNQILPLPNGNSINLTIQYIPQQSGWFITSLTYLNFTLQGVRITNSPNMLHQFRNQIPFGLACYTTAQREPTQQQDFLSGASTLYLLSQADVMAYAEFLTDG